MVMFLVAVHVVVCLFLIFVVLLQSAQAADLAGAFGGGGSQTALGMRSATTILQKATTGAAVLFMVTSLALGLFGGQRGSSVIQGLDDPNAQPPVIQEEAGEDDGAAAPGEEGDEAAAEDPDGAAEGDESDGETSGQQDDGGDR